MTTVWILISLAGNPVPQFFRHAYSNLATCRAAEKPAHAKCMAIPVGVQ